MLLPADVMDELERQFHLVHDTGRQQYSSTIRNCKYSQVLLMMGENIDRNMYCRLGMNKKTKIFASFWSSITIIPKMHGQTDVKSVFNCELQTDDN